MTLALKDDGKQNQSSQSSQSDKVFPSGSNQTSSQTHHHHHHATRLGAVPAAVGLFCFLLALSSVIMSRARAAQANLASVSAASSSGGRSPRISALNWLPSGHVRVPRDLRHQCLHLSTDTLPSICDSSDQLLEQLPADCRLEYCDRFSLKDVFPPKFLGGLASNGTACHHELDILLATEREVRKRVDQFDTLLRRYNCQSGYSVKWDCRECSRTYRDWSCAMLIPLHILGARVKPCRSVCERVEQRCPYFHPASKEQYAGEPVFLCIDPQIPFNHDLMSEVSYGEPGQCYETCHLTPLTTTPSGSEGLADSTNSSSSNSSIEQNKSPTTSEVTETCSYQQLVDLVDNSLRSTTPSSNTTEFAVDTKTAATTVGEAGSAPGQTASRTSVSSSHPVIKPSASSSNKRRSPPDGSGSGGQVTDAVGDLREKDRPPEARADPLVRVAAASSSLPSVSPTGYGGSSGGALAATELAKRQLDLLGDSEDLDDDLDNLNSLTTETTVTRLKGIGSS